MYIEKILNKLFGKIEYVVTIVNSAGSIQHSNGLLRIKDVDRFIDDINTDKYWNVQKIEKIRRYDFKYSKQVIHAPLFLLRKM